MTESSSSNPKNKKKGQLVNNNSKPIKINYLKALKRLGQSPQSTDLKKWFNLAIKTVDKKHVNEQDYETCYSLIEFASMHGHTYTIKHLLKHFPVELLNYPWRLKAAIIFAAKNGHHEALQTLINNQDVINKLLKDYHINLNLDMAVEVAATMGHHQALNILLTKNILQNLSYYSPTEFNSIEKQLNKWQKGGNKKFKNTADTALKTIREIKNERNYNTAKAAIVTGVLAGLATTIVGGTFVGVLLTKKVQNLFKDNRLVFNYLLPLFNKINNQLMEISPKLDLNNLAKTLANPKIAGLMIGIIVAFVAIGSALVAFVKAQKAQCGSFGLGL
jgi:hypothetical protein